jgi:hypothetical protein
VSWYANRTTQALWMEQRFDFLKTRHLEEGQTLPLEKVQLFLDIIFLVNGIDNLP